jgi:hypothetical protein
MVLASAAFYFKSWGVQFEVSPQRFSSCDLPSNMSELNWSVKKSGVTSVAIFVNGMGEPESLWGPGELIGSRKTGAWVSDGLTFTLRDQSGNLLAKRTIDTTRCVGVKIGE